ncbi:hypothetical protein [Microbacterium sp. K24]|uniref:hypothetical protein n=1 Tax=Microbacterium sp. K24 TaxID=2305446 RepID=UPI00109CAF61|nr:hypothetical protein [Microbacterium sp. K24]
MIEISVEELAAYDNRCTAVTRRGKQCLNPVFNGQWYSWMTVTDEVLPDKRRIVRDVAVVHDGDYQRMLEHVCVVHEETHSGRRV